MIQLLLSFGLLLACGDDEELKQQPKQKSVKEEVEDQLNKREKEEKARKQEAIKRNQELVKRIEEQKIQDELARNKLLQEKLEADRIKAQPRTVNDIYNVEVKVYCLINDPEGAYCQMCLDEFNPLNTLKLCNEAIKEKPHGGQCYKTSDLCLNELRN